MLDYSVQYEVKMVECRTRVFQGTKGLFPSNQDSRKRRVQSMAHISTRFLEALLQDIIFSLWRCSVPKFLPQLPPEVRTDLV